MIQTEKHTAGTFIFSLISEFLPKAEISDETYEGPMDDRVFYGTMAILIAALALMAIVFRAFR